MESMEDSSRMLDLCTIQEEQPLQCDADGRTTAERNHRDRQSDAHELPLVSKRNKTNRCWE